MGGGEKMNIVIPAIYKEPVTANIHGDGHSAILAWRGHGSSEHLETHDITWWKNLLLDIHIDWTGNCTLTATGASVLRRDSLGATLILQTLIETEEKRAAAEHVSNIARFPGPCFNIARGDASSIMQSSSGPREVIEAPHQNYPGVSMDEVVAPFIILGRGNVKNADRFHMEKIHINHVYNSITYRGQMHVIRIDNEGNEHEVPASTLLQIVEAASLGKSGEHAAVHAIRFTLNAKWSSACIACVARVYKRDENSVAEQPFEIAASKIKKWESVAPSPPIILQPLLRTR